MLMPSPSAATSAGISAVCSLMAVASVTRYLITKGECQGEHEHDEGNTRCPRQESLDVLGNLLAHLLRARGLPIRVVWHRLLRPDLARTLGGHGPRPELRLRQLDRPAVLIQGLERPRIDLPLG